MNAPLPILVHLGCGTNAPEGWINVDGSWNARLSRYPLLKGVLRRLGIVPKGVDFPPHVLYHDVRRPLPFSDGSVDAVYASHLLEHLHMSDACALMRECHRVLRPGGRARMVVPDLKAYVEAYLAGQGAVPADDLNRSLMMHPASHPEGGTLHRVYTSFTQFHTHKWMYDAQALAARFTDAGFVEVAERRLHESAIPGIEAVESASRLSPGRGIGVEGTRP